MKLRSLTNQETIEVLYNIRKRFEVLNEINSIAISILRREYEIYKSTFKYSWKHPFTFNPQQFQGFQNEICGGYIRQGELPDYLGSLKVEFINRGYMYDRVRVFVNKHDDNIVRAAAHNSSIFREILYEGSEKFYYLLHNYAVQPFELSGDEYVKLREINKSLVELESQLEDYKNATVQSN